LLKSSLSRRFYQDFLESYQSFSQKIKEQQLDDAYVYVDHDGITFLSDVLDEDGESGAFALSVDGSGYLQLLTTEEQ